MKILSIRGGGIRGLAVAQLLKDVESLLGKPIGSYFDLIAGTSTGGILALALGLGIPAASIVQFYLEDGPGIFRRSPLHAFGLFGSKYNGTNLRQALDKRFNSKPLAECKTRTMVTTTNLVTSAATFLKSWKLDDFPAALAGQCTAAAPTYFDAVEVKHPQVSGIFADGGLFANNPSLFAFAEGVELDAALDDFKVLDIACPRPDPIPDVGNGIVRFGRDALNVILDSGMNAVEEACKRFLGKRYLKVQPDLGKASSAMDDTSETNLIALTAVGRAAAQTCAKELITFIK